MGRLEVSMRLFMASGLSLSLSLSFLALACGSNGPGFAMTGETPDSGPIGMIEGGAPPPPPPGCDIKKVPSEDPCVVDESAGIFVSAALGSSAGDGTRKKPFASIQAGIDFAKASKRRVYVCAETYKESVVFADGISVFGNIDCSQGVWKPTTSRALVASPTSPAATAIDLETPTRIDSLDVVAPDVAAGSSIAMVVATSNMRLVNVRLHGGNAAAGADGGNGMQLTDSGAAKNGVDANGDTTCNTMSFICLGGPSSPGGTNQCMGKSITPGAGGAGGDPGHKTSEYDQNISGYAWHVKSTASNPGGLTGTGGTIGMNGKPGVGYFNGETRSWSSGDGTAGTDGGAGLGGTGGAGYYTAEPNPAASYVGYQHWGIAGGGGGAGGCPGLAAEPGKGGGASVGLLSFTASLVIEASTIESSDGGAGGKSGIPSVPTLGGAGGASKLSALAGGQGGIGGNAGVSGNGSGGPSFAIAANKDNMPSVDGATSLKPGKPGPGVQARTIDVFQIAASEDGKSGGAFAF